MKNKLCTTILAFILIVSALALSASALENITYNYTYSATGEQLEAGSTDGDANTLITLPNVSWNLQLGSEDEKFSTVFSDINYTFKKLTVNGTEIDIVRSYDTDSEFTDDPERQYVAKYAYAMSIPQLSSRTHTITMDNAATYSRPYIFQCPYDFFTDTANTSILECTKHSASSAGGTAYSATVTGFSAFFLANEDHPVVTQPASYTPGGSGGGGGGGGRPPSLVYVTPTPKGETVQLYNGDELVIIFKDQEYHYRVIKVRSQVVTLRSLSNYLTIDIDLGDEKRIGLESFLSDDVRASMHIVDGFALVNFRTSERAPFAFPLLPPRSRVQPAVPEDQVVDQPGLVTPTRPQTPPTVAAPTQPTVVPETALPESPVNLWTILLGLLFVALLVGGFVVYRAKLAHTDKPPTVARADQPIPSGPSVSATAQLPGSSTLPTEPASQSVQSGAIVGSTAAAATVAARPTLMKRMVAKTEERFKSAEAKVAALVQPKTKPVAYHIPKAKMLELQGFIYHAYSLGYSAAQAKAKLVEKGWPPELVDQVIGQIKIAK